MYLKTVQFGNLMLSNVQKTEIKDNIERSIIISTMKYDKNKGNLITIFFREISFSKRKRITSGSMYTFNFYSNNFLLHEKNNKVYKLYSLYSCLNCEFAKWTKNTLFNLIKDIPWRHQIELTNSGNSNEIETRLQSININELQDLVKFVNRCIHVLSTLIFVEPFAMLSNETIVLQSLYELKLKILFNDNKIENNRIFTILEALVIINALQNFILTNCKEDIPYYEMSTPEAIQRIFGYTIQFNEPYQIELFFYNIQPLKLESYLCCTDEEMFLIRLVIDNDGTRKHTDMSNALGSAKVFVENDGVMTLTEIILNVKKIRDIIRLYFYLQSILFVIMNIINIKIQHFFSNYEKFDYISVTRIKDLADQLKLSTFPAEFLNFFNRLQEIMSFESIPLNVSYKMSDIYQEQFKNIKLETDEKDYTVFRFVNDLLKHKHDFVCFNKTFTFLQSSFRRYVTPYNLAVEKIKDIRSSVNENDDVQNGCRFIDSVYAICLQITIGLKKMGSFKTYSSDGSDNILSINEKYKTMKKYFLWAINGGKIQDDNFLIIAYKSAIILVNQKFTEMAFFVQNVERPVYLIMTELSDYGIKFCSALRERKGYMLYDNVDFNGIYDDDTIKVNISQSLQISFASLDIMPTHDQFDLEFLYVYLVRGSDVIEKYKEIVKFYWEGSARSIEEIYIYVTSSIKLNPHLLNEFYNFFFKFYIVAFFYEIAQFYGISEKPNKYDVNEYNLCVNNFSDVYFPETMKTFINRLKGAAQYPTFSFKDLRMYRYWLANHFKNDIDDFFVVIEPNIRVNDFSSATNVHLNCINNIKDINKEISIGLKNISDMYSLIYKDFMNTLVIKS